MNYLDIIMGGLILYGAVKGFFKGFIIEFASIVALIAGILGALLFASSSHNERQIPGNQAQ